MTEYLDTVRRMIGRRDNITRTEMHDILTALQADGLDLRNGCMLDTFEVAAPWGGHDNPYPVSEHAATAWANGCRGISCISVMDEGSADYHYDGQVRYDQPGSMHPLQHASLTFVSSDLSDSDVECMRDHADRVLLVSGAPLTIDAPESGDLPWVEALRRLPDLHVDGTWTRVLDDGTLEMRDPNDGQSCEPADKSRHQYRVDRETGEMLYRHLPPESVGDEWIDIGAPEWEPRTTDISLDTPMYAYWEALVQ